MDKGKKCKTANKTAIKDCYEFTYEPIKSQNIGSKGKGEG